MFSSSFLHYALAQALEVLDPELTLFLPSAAFVLQFLAKV